MTYPPGNPGYPPAQSPGSYGASAASSFGKSEDSDSNLKHYLTIAVAVLGVLTYLASYFPMVSRVLPNGDELVEKGSTLPVDLILLAGLLAAVNLLPKAKNLPRGGDRGIGAGCAVADPGHHRRLGSRRRIVDRSDCRCRAGRLAIGALLLDAGVITAPAPRPKYDQYYGQYGGYYGQQQAPYQQSGYGTQYGGYPSGPTTGGFTAQPGPQQSQQGSATPPTGFPSFSPPPSSGSGSGAPGQGNANEQGGSGHSQHSYGSGQQPQAPSSQPGQSQS